MKKEQYRHRLPHFHTPGQDFFITWSLKNAIPAHAFEKYSLQLESAKTKIEQARKKEGEVSKIDYLKKQYNQIRRKKLKTFHEFLDAQRKSEVDLSKKVYTDLIKESLFYWEKNKISNFAFSIMPNHIHWVIGVNTTDMTNQTVYLQDVLSSVKKYTASRINLRENRNGRLWQKESFDTTIRDQNHLKNAIVYTLNNPVKAGLCKHWANWPGDWCHKDYIDWTE
ncbi:transposase IS200 family protein [Marinilabilia salmonicolor]|jgi:REP element-mobilizing transposase RayT|uniref:transposase n=1 Tax=Marinilabilia salmonicolor TaxID=989 RepID=UPI000D074585|nr:transposase [Marinilabilia salmonicolor]PRZ01043.1 transposase IS200 family protein [Marinilabilia salmonicolor]